MEKKNKKKKHGRIPSISLSFTGVTGITWKKSNLFKNGRMFWVASMLLITFRKLLHELDKLSHSKSQ